MLTLIVVVVGLSGALIFGAADFLGGLASKRISSIRVTAIAAVSGLVVLLLALPLIGGGTPPAEASQLAWVKVQAVVPVFVAAGLVLPNAQTVLVAEDGTWSVDCVALPEVWAYRFTAVVGGGLYTHERTVTVPVLGTVAYADLVDVVVPTSPVYASPVAAMVDAVLADPTSAPSTRLSATIATQVDTLAPPAVDSAITAQDIPSQIATAIALQSGKVVQGSGAPNGVTTAGVGTRYMDTAKTLGTGEH